MMSANFYIGAQDIVFVAPDGTAIQGAVQEGGESYWRVTWAENESGGADFVDYEDGGPDSPDWETVNFIGEVAYIDENGRTWLERHLIREEAPPLSEEACALARRDLVAARAADLCSRLERDLRQEVTYFGLEPINPNGPGVELIAAAKRTAALADDRAEQLAAEWATMIAFEKDAGRGVFVSTDEEEG